MRHIKFRKLIEVIEIEALADMQRICQKMEISDDPNLQNDGALFLKLCRSIRSNSKISNTFK